MLPPIPHGEVTPKATPEKGVCDSGLGSRRRLPLAAVGIDDGLLVNPNLGNASRQCPVTARVRALHGV